METSFDYIKENLNAILYNINDACAKYRKNDELVSLVAVTKTVPPEAVNFAVSCGVTILGENKVQEFLSKKDFYSKSPDIHFIGHLQSNKVKYIIDYVSLIQSVDSFKLASEINKQAQRTGKIQDILVEVNIGDEISKSGVSENSATELVYQISELPNVKVKGLMAIPPAGCDEKLFFKMQKLFIDISEKNVDNIDMSVLSMGMSGDYLTAIKYGATMVRIGSALFGARIYN